jgi:succinoglycan biosynthesis protein ExoL
MQEEKRNGERSPSRHVLDIGLRELAVRSIAFFGHDSGESTIIKRVAAFQANGCEVLGFMFRRGQDTPGEPLGWDNVHLGVTVDRNYAKRLPKLLSAVIKVLRRRNVLARCQTFYARNVDMLAIAVMARALTQSRAVLVYEVLDVQRIFVGNGPVNRLFRWAERVLLKSCNLLVVSSPDFMSCYFLPYQNYAGAWRLLENKVSPLQFLRGPSPAARPPEPPPWVIGWFGRLRCRRSLEILCRIADTLGKRVHIRLRGLPSEEDVPIHALEAACASRTNLVYEGGYDSRRDLPDMYAGVHFSWCIDYLDVGTNSDWLLPNRIYEGSLFGSLALARKNTATSRKVEREGLGWAFAEPLEEQVCAFLNTLEVETYERARSVVEGANRSLFVDETDTRELLEYLDDCALRQASAGSAGAK